MRIRKSMVVLLMVAAAPAALAQAVRTWVSGAGIDTNPCTLTQPCRNFAAAIGQVADGGEVVALDSAGYGPVTINKQVSLVAPQGVHAAIAPTSTAAITVLAQGDDHIIIRNLFLNSQGAGTGIDGHTVGALYVERSVISGFTSYGILFEAVNVNARLYLSDTTLRKNGTAGVNVRGDAAGARAMINSTRFFQNFVGVATSGGAHATVRNSVASGGNAGFSAGAIGSAIFLEDCLSTHNVNGVEAIDDALITLTRCEINHNTLGIKSWGLNAEVFVMDSTLAGNTTALEHFFGGAITSRLDNTLQDNGTEGTFTGAFLAD